MLLLLMVYFLMLVAFLMPMVLFSCCGFVIILMPALLTLAQGGARTGAVRHRSNIRVKLLTCSIMFPHITCDSILSPDTHTHTVLVPTGKSHRRGRGNLGGEVVSQTKLADGIPAYRDLYPHPSRRAACICNAHRTSSAEPRPQEVFCILGFEALGCWSPSLVSPNLP